MLNKASLLIRGWLRKRSHFMERDKSAHFALPRSTHHYEPSERTSLLDSSHVAHKAAELAGGHLDTLWVFQSGCLQELCLHIPLETQYAQKLGPTGAVKLLDFF